MAKHSSDLQHVPNTEHALENREKKTTEIKCESQEAYDGDRRDEYANKSNGNDQSLTGIQTTSMTSDQRVNDDANEYHRISPSEDSQGRYIDFVPKLNKVSDCVVEDSGFVYSTLN